MHSKQTGVQLQWALHFLYFHGFLHDPGEGVAVKMGDAKLSSYLKINPAYDCEELRDFGLVILSCYFYIQLLAL